MAACRSRRGAQGGQALLLILAVMLLTALLVAVFTTLWVRGTVRARQYGDATAARYAAEAGISRVLAGMAAGEIDPPATLSGAVDPAAGPATYQVTIEPDGPGRWVVTSTGMQGKARHATQVTVVAPLTMPVYAGGDLNLHVVPKDGSLQFSMPPGYGAQFSMQGAGTASPGPVRTSISLPDLSFATFAALAGTPPAQRLSLAASGGTLLDGAWYDGGHCAADKKPHSGSLTVPPGATAGVLGDLVCSTITLEPGATLVVTGALSAGSLTLQEGARLVVGQDADPDDIRVGPASSQPQPVLVVAGGGLRVKGALAGETGGIAGSPPIAILALDRSRCTLAACGPDDSNRIGITDLEVAEFLLYSEPVPEGTSAICVEIGGPDGNTSNQCQGQAGAGGSSNTGGSTGHGEGAGAGSGQGAGGGRLPLVRVRGAVVAGGDVEIIARRVEVEWTMGFDVLARYFGVLPGQAFYTVAGWRE